MAESNRCAQTKSDGSPCRTRPLKGSRYCFFHDPSKAEERRSAGRKGGEKGKIATLSSLTPDIQLDSAQDVVRLIAETISQVRRGDIDPRIANAVGYLSGVALKAREQGELEDRLKTLEEEIERNRGTSVTRIRKTG